MNSASEYRQMYSIYSKYIESVNRSRYSMYSIKKYTSSTKYLIILIGFIINNKLPPHKAHLLL